MNIDDKTVDHLAHLARLEFSGEKKDEIKNDLNRILSFVDKLKELDTEGVEPLIYMTDEFNVLRKDEPSIQVTHAEALKNAPDRDSDYFRAPRVVENKNQ